MKRSEINGILKRNIRFLAKHRFLLPPFAYWTPADWRKKGAECREIVDQQLGWDITDFGSGDFTKRGLLLFTIRNGNLEAGGKNYAEKIMIVRENQETPMHFHWSKMEDIINRGGGNLVIELHDSTLDGNFLGQPLQVSIDAIKRTVAPGGTVTLTPGESICLEPGMYHRFYGEPGKGTVLVGEVSKVNDDTKDNRFYEQVGRFPAIDEDTEPNHLLVSDYGKYI